MHSQSFEQVLCDFEGLIKNQIKKLRLTRHFDEYYQVGVVALWEAYRNFDPERGSFAAFALHTVRGHMLMMLRKEKRFGDYHVLHDEHQTTAYIDEQTSYHLDSSLFSSLTPYLSHLTEREQLWVVEAIIHDKKLGEIAREHGVSTNTVSSWRKQAIRKLRSVHLPVGV